MRHLALPQLALALAASAPFAQAQDKPKPNAPLSSTPIATPPAPPKPDVPGEPKAYDKVVTADFKTQDGLLKVHSHKGKHLFEIPKAEIGKEWLLVVQVKKSPAGASYPGQGVEDIVVRWEQRENKVLLRAISYANVADPSNPVSKAVEAMNTAPILMSFQVEAFAKDGSPVIDATRLFTSDVNEIPVKKAVQGTMLDGTRSFIDKVRTFPGNLNVEATQTFNPKPLTPPPGFPPQFLDMLPSPPSRTAVVHYSFVKLPEKPMLGRLADERVGYFTHDTQDFGRDDHEVVRRRFIARWRLEKKDPAAEKSEPVKPIVFHVDPATPAKWVPFIKKGIEAWKPAFEAAGFVNAIQAADAPKDADWSADDARYSVIRWVPSATANAMGPHVSDPRSGEILEADIEIYHNVQQLARDWYWAQVGMLDPRAATLPIPDAIMGEILAYIVTHEVGHSLGLPHNFKSSATYTIEQIRDKNWVKKNSHVSTLMDYARFNYVAQPEDGIAPEDLIPKIGPYDVFSIQWGYKPIPGAKTSDEEKPTLNEWCKVQETTPYLRFSTAGARGADPGDQTEAVGDIDAVKATGLGIKNLKRAMAMLPKAVLKPGEDFEQLSHMYDALWGQLRLELGHVANIPGGFDSEPKVGTAPGGRFTPLGRARQQEAVKFLNEQVFKTPTWILDQAILQKLEPTTGQMRLVGLQRGVLMNLLAQGRLARLQEHEASVGDKAYTAGQLLSDLRGGIFTELTAGAVKVDPFRRNLQRAYIELLASRVNAPGGDDRAAIRAELKSLQGLFGAKAAAADKATRAHLEDLKDQVIRALDPKSPSSGAPAMSPARLEE